MRIFLPLLFLLLSKVTGSQLADDQVSSILDQLVELRTEMGHSFRSPMRSYEDPGYEIVVHSDRGIAEARWLAKIMGSEFIGPMRGFSDLYVFRTFRPLNTIENQRMRRDLASAAARSRAIWSEIQTPQRRLKRDLFDFNDPLFKSQWEINGENESGGDMRIVDAWRAGFTGKGVVVSILDDGVDYTHDDLKENYDPLASYDLNGNTNDPMPTLDNFNKHGTRCAGEIAMAANNSRCGVGVAFDSRIGGVRMLDGRINDRVEAEALTMLIEHADILSASWGPGDEGETVEGPGRLAKMGLQKGVQMGREGKGLIYVWASGNGGQIDDCNADGYSNSPFTFTVSAATGSGEFPWYGEHCAATLTTAFSSGKVMQKKIVTLDPGNRCSTSHTGTSAAAPIAAGIIALALEANSQLTWREVQHLAAYTSNPSPLMKSSDWRKNGAGLWASGQFGFGLIDAAAMTTMAKEMNPIGDQKKCVFTKAMNGTVTYDQGIVVKFQVDGCAGQNEEINALEHVQLIADIEADARGLLSIWLESPSGMLSQLIGPRIRDRSSDGFRNWPFMSVHFWGENPKGTWKVHVDQVKGTSKKADFKSVVQKLSLVLFGTKEIPEHAKTPREYAGLPPDQPKKQPSSFSADEIEVEAADIERTIQNARTALKRRSPTVERQLVEMDDLVRKLRSFNERRRFPRAVRIFE